MILRDSQTRLAHLLRVLETGLIPNNGAEMNTTLNILHISNLYPPNIVGGAEVVCSDLAEAAARDGHRVTVITTENPKVLEDRGMIREQRNGVDVIRFFPKNLYWIRDQGNPSVLKKALWHARDGWNTHAAEVVGRLLDEIRPDIMHTHNIDGFSPVVWAEARKRGIPVVHTSHDLHLVCPRATLIRRSGEICKDAPLPCQLYRKWYSHRTTDVRRFCSPSQFLLDVHQEMGMSAEKFEVVRNGIPMPWLEAPRAQEDRKAPSPLRLFFMGQLGRHKGIDTVIDAIRLLPLDVPVELEIAGKGDMESYVLDAITQDPRIRYHGFVRGDEKYALMSSADLFVIASTYYDNAPLSIIEAYGFGVPVLASRIGGLPEMVVDGRTGRLFEPGDAAALADLIRSLASDPSVLAPMRAAASGEVPKYTVQAMYERYAAIYREEAARV